jgi:hypothetical protein
MLKFKANVIITFFIASDASKLRGGFARQQPRRSSSDFIDNQSRIFFYEQTRSHLRKRPDHRTSRKRASSNGALRSQRPFDCCKSPRPHDESVQWNKRARAAFAVPSSHDQREQRLGRTSLESGVASSQRQAARRSRRPDASRLSGVAKSRKQVMTY